MYRVGKSHAPAAVLAILFFAFFMTGCSGGKEEAAVNGVSIGKDGKIEGCIVEDFDKEYYTPEELDNMVQTELDEYNGDKEGKKILLKSMDSVMNAQSGAEQVVVRMEYASAQDYREFNGTELFYGTIAQAVQAGYHMDVTLTNVKKQEDTVSKEALLAMDDRHIVITEEKMQITLPGNAQYVSGNVRNVNSRTVETMPEDGYSYILIK